jgi:metal-responsive CopG/Arc/MetJ family transcriptional regulator
MKTAVSIPDDVFTDAERLAKTLKCSRSQLYSSALREYVARHAPDEITAALDRVYGAEATEEDLDEARFVQEAARQTLLRSTW